MEFFENRPQNRKEYQKRMDELRKLIAEGISKIGTIETEEKKLICPYEIMLAMRYIRLLSDTDVVNLRRGFFWEDGD